MLCKNAVEKGTLALIHGLMADEQQNLLQDYEKKYAATNTIIAKTALLYYDDIDFTVPIMLINHKTEWPAIKERIATAIKHPQHIFSASALRKNRKSGL